jgi:hypothetical protein
MLERREGEGGRERERERQREKNLCKFDVLVHRIPE